MSILYKHFMWLGTVFFLFSAVIATPSFASSALFTVAGVAVDVRAVNALSARNQAFEEAQVKAFTILAQRTLSAAEFSELVTPDIITISTLIKDYEVTQEKLSAVRYIGTYTFRFKDRAVRQFFSQSGLRYTDVSSKPILIVPFYQGYSDMSLWGLDNIWMSAWARVGTNAEGLVPFVVPIGDLQDMRDISGDQAMSYDNMKLAKMLRRYDAKEAILAIGLPNTSLLQAKNPDDIAFGSLKINLYRTDREQPEHVRQIFVDAEIGESRKDFYDKAVRRVQQELRQDWKAKTIVMSADTSVMNVHVGFTSLPEWVRIQRALGRVYGIEQVDIKSITPRYAAVALSYQGDERRLRLALEQADFALSAPQIETNILGMHIQKKQIYNLTLRDPKGVFLP